MRNVDVRDRLSARRREMQHDVRERIRDGRADRANDGRDDIEQSDDDSQGNIELALLGMRAEALMRVDEALTRLDAGKYGACVDCAARIAVRRLRALPFAVRCRDCEATRERDQGRARRLAESRAISARFSDAAGC
jgi:DnaK suppressor protein